MPEIKCLVYIKSAATGEVRIDKQEWLLPDENGFSSRYIWADGNFACDCNRELFFRRCGGEDPDVLSTDCGDECFSVKITDEAGAVLYKDDRWED